MSDSEQLASWQAIVTLLVFLATIAVLVFPFSIIIPVPLFIVQHVDRTIVRFRLKPPSASREDAVPPAKRSRRHPHQIVVPMNFVTAPLLAVLFSLAAGIIGRQEVHDGTVGADNIEPLDIMAFFLALAYIAISIDASGLIRFLAFWVVKKGGKVGHRLYLYLYIFFFGLGTFVGNDPIILSGTAFLAYLTRVAANIKHPRAWIYSQFAIANISSAILVSSNPTNLVLAGAFNITFTNYTANMIVPVAVTAIALVPFLLYLIFPSTDLIPLKLELRQLPDAEAPAVLTDSPVAMDSALEIEDESEPELDQEAREAREREMLPLEDLIDPFIDTGGAIFGGVVISITLAAILATNAAHTNAKVYMITVPAAFITLCRDVVYDFQTWKSKLQTPESSPASAPDGDEGPTLLFGNSDGSAARFELRAPTPASEKQTLDIESPVTPTHLEPSALAQRRHTGRFDSDAYGEQSPVAFPERSVLRGHAQLPTSSATLPHALPTAPLSIAPLSSDIQLHSLHELPAHVAPSPTFPSFAGPSRPIKPAARLKHEPQVAYNRRTLVDVARDLKATALMRFPTVCAVLQHLPFPLVPFAFCMFTLVQGLVKRGWVGLFAGWWAAWVNKTGIVGAVGGMGFLSVVMCNFSGTNIGATILLSRVLQQWIRDHPMSDRLHDATLYALAIGVNYGAFSFTFSASLAGLLWRDILGRKSIHVRRLDFARINLPIISISMAIGCSVLVAQVYIVKNGSNFTDHSRL